MRQRQIVIIARFTLLEAARTRLFWLFAGALALVFGATFFVQQLAIIESARLQIEFSAAATRLVAVFMLCLHVLSSIVREFNDKGLELTLSFDLRRSDYVLGRLLGFGAVALAMIEEFKRAPLRRPIHLLLSYDEETTCLGPVDTIARFGEDLPRPGAVIIGEPTMMRVADAHKSVATHVTRVRGHEAHSSNPALGANAIEVACELVSELYRFAAELTAEGDPSGRFTPGASTVSVGVINGGSARNILAKDCAFHWEYRGLPGAPADRARRRLEDYIAASVTPRFAARAGSPTDRPNYRGVFYDRKNGRWRSQLGYQNRKVSLVCWAAAG